MRGRTGRENPLYPASFWNVKKRVDEDIPWTNKAVDGFHTVLRSSITCEHPNVRKLIAGLKKEEELQQTKIIHVNRGDASARKKIYKNIDRQLKTLVNTYDNSNKVSFLENIVKILTLAFIKNSWCYIFSNVFFRLRVIASTAKGFNLTNILCSNII